MKDLAKISFDITISGNEAVGKRIVDMTEKIVDQWVDQSKSEIKEKDDTDGGKK